LKKNKVAKQKSLNNYLVTAIKYDREKWLTHLMMMMMMMMIMMMMMMMMMIGDTILLDEPKKYKAFQKMTVNLELSQA
jgi:hypothetical protein